MIRIKSMLILVLGVLLSYSAKAQLFKKMIDRTADKISQKVEDKVVEGISTELANRAVRPLDNIYDEIFREQYKATYGEDYDDSKYENDEERANAMTAMLNSMYGSVDLPPSYTFEYALEIETYDYGEKKPNKMKMFINPNSAIMGIEQNEDGTKYMVFDFEKDIMTVYDEEAKTAMAIPNVMKMASTFAANSMDQGEDFSFEKMKKTKKILDCESQGYKTKTDEEESEFYVCDDLAFGWKDSFGRMLQKTAPNFYKEGQYADINGMMLEANTKRNKDKKESKWITKKIDEKQFVIKNDEYKLNNTAFSGY